MLLLMWDEIKTHIVFQWKETYNTNVCTTAECTFLLFKQDENEATDFYNQEEQIY